MLPRETFGVGRKILSWNFSANSIRCSVRRSTNNGLLCQADAVGVGLGCMHILLSPSRLASPHLSYRRHHCSSSALTQARCTFLRSRFGARVRTHASARYTCVRSRSRARNFANSCICFIYKPLRTPEMAEMVKMAKVLVLEQHSHFFTIQPVSIRNKRCNVE